MVEVVKTQIVNAEMPSRFVAVLQQDAASPAFILTVDIEGRSLTVRRVAADVQIGKSYELWLVSDRFPAPRSLGVVGDKEFTVDNRLAAYDPATITTATYAVTLEPEGGSPTGAPSSDVLWAGKLVQALPGARPSGPGRGRLSAREARNAANDLRGLLPSRNHRRADLDRRLNGGGRGPGRRRLCADTDGDNSDRSNQRHYDDLEVSPAVCGDDRCIVGHGALPISSIGRLCCEDGSVVFLALTSDEAGVSRPLIPARALYSVVDVS